MICSSAAPRRCVTARPASTTACATSAKPVTPGPPRSRAVRACCAAADGTTALSARRPGSRAATVDPRHGPAGLRGRTDTRSGTRIEGVLPAGPGWVARAPDATINITPTGLVISTPAGDFTEPATGFWAGP